MGRITQTLILAGIVVAMVLLLSPLSVRWWQGPTETPSATQQILTVTGQTTIAGLAQMTGLELPTLRHALQVPPSTDPAQSLDALGISPAAVQPHLQRALALRAQEATKNWRTIASKFLLLGFWLTGVIFLLKRRRITPTMRLLLLAVAVLIFGVVYGADQSPMGTVKDTLVLWGQHHLLFPPRLIALAVFLLMVILAHKSICGWGCQFGVLQDLLFHLNRNATSRVGILPQVKLPFAITNSIRILVVVVAASLALIWGVDLIEPVNPFTIYNPTQLAITGAVVVGVLLVASLFIYRPWCHLACPFGLLGWLVERFSRQRVRVDYHACVGCGACARACPSMAMQAILHQERVRPDCFACGACVTTCPHQAITFDNQPQMSIPDGTFAPKSTTAAPTHTDT
ncbi:MAG: 4Fe-4S binding protein [Armatimonadota bacterium]